MESALLLFIITVFLCYVYAFVGGFTDAANAIATSVGSRVLSPRSAVLIAGFFELLGALTGTAVALTIGKGIVDTAALTQVSAAAAILGAMSWSLFTYRFGIPVSETHGLIGGILGVGIANAGLECVKWGKITKVLIAIIASPLIGFFSGLLLILIIYSIFRNVNRSKIVPSFKWLQRLSCIYMAFSHGRNDAQKPMGILAMAVAVYFGYKTLDVPLWIILSCGLVAAVGVAYGGWRIVRTLGMRITALEPVQGFAAETAAATALQIASQIGIPVSTTHTITSSIAGVGATRRFSAIRWGVILEIVFSWVLTLPVTIVLGALFFILLEAIF